MAEKLVRDKIPTIVEERTGVRPPRRTAGGKEYRRLLEEKLAEEVGEYLAAPSLEELADILEVILHLAGEAGFTPEELEAARRAKEDERGGFRGRQVMDFPPAGQEKQT